MVQQIVKFGGGRVIMWGCMTPSGPSMMCRIDEEWISTYIEKF